MRLGTNHVRASTGCQRNGVQEQNLDRMDMIKQDGGIETGGSKGRRVGIGRILTKTEGVINPAF